jgi:hypothetical protein
VGWGELAHARRAGKERVEGGQGLILVADGETAFKVMVELDAFAGVGAAIGARGNGQGVTGEGDGVVIGDGALVVEAEDILGEEG